MRVLVVEDDQEISAALRTGLEDVGYDVHIVRDGERAIRLLSRAKFSVVLLDLMLPGADGFRVCQSMRESGDTTPVLMLTARDAVKDRVTGLDTGADDYLAKPFEFEELLARIRALLRRELAAKSAVVQVEDLVVDTAKRRVERGGRPIHLTPREYDLLVALAMRSSRILTREIIQQIVWNADDTSSNTVDAHMRNLRKKIDHAFPKKLIHTIYGVGYILKSEA
jgi:two-component system copper resistance phosphate regulon response regulator CusR